MSRVATKHIKGFLTPEEGKRVYDHLIETIEWEEGIRSRKGFTRLAKPLRPDQDPMVTDVLIRAMSKLGLKNHEVLGIYLNYYQDGTMWTPSHNHQGQKQVVISLGATRTLKVGAKNYPMENGDLIFFGSSYHQVPKEPEITEGRISIAAFCIPDEVVPADATGDQMKDIISRLKALGFAHGDIIVDGDNVILVE